MMGSNLCLVLLHNVFPGSSSDFGPNVCNSTHHIKLYLGICATVFRLGCKLVLTWEVYRDLPSHCLSHLGNLCISTMKLCSLPLLRMTFSWDLEAWKGTGTHSLIPQWLRLLQASIVRSLQKCLQMVVGGKESQQEFKQMALILDTEVHALDIIYVYACVFVYI